MPSGFSSTSETKMMMMTSNMTNVNKSSMGRGKVLGQEAKVGGLRAAKALAVLAFLVALAGSAHWRDAEDSSCQVGSGASACGGSEKGSETIPAIPVGPATQLWGASLVLQGVEAAVSGPSGAETGENLKYGLLSIPAAARP